MIAKNIIKNSFIKVDKNDTISKLIGKFQTSKKHNAIVLDGKNYVGIVSKRKLMKTKIRASEEKIKHILTKPAVLKGGESIEKVAALMYTSDVHMLPVVKNKKVAGVIYAMDVIKALLPKIAEKRVSEVSSGRVVAFDQHMEIKKAMKMMRYKKIDRAPIVNKRNKLMGIISIVDLILKFEMFHGRRQGGKNTSNPLSSPGKQKEAASVYVIHEATIDVVTVMMQDRVKTAVRLMSKNNISDVVIIDPTHIPTGIITIKDLLKLF